MLTAECPDNSEYVTDTDHNDDDVTDEDDEDPDTPDLRRKSLILCSDKSHDADMSSLLQ